MDTSDIKDYLQARKSVPMTKVLSAIFFIFACSFPFYDNLGISSYLPQLIPMFAMLIVGQIWFGFSGVSQQKLLDIMERQIARDPEALQKLSTLHKTKI